MKEKAPRKQYKRRGPRGHQVYIPIVDDTFFSRSEFHAPHGNDPKCDLPNVGGCGFSEVRVLNADGECVRIISVDELNARQGKQWHIGHNPEGKRSSKRSVKTKNGTPTQPD